MRSLPPFSRLVEGGELKLARLADAPFFVVAGIGQTDEPGDRMHFQATAADAVAGLISTWDWASGPYEVIGYHARSEGHAEFLKGQLLAEELEWLGSIDTDVELDPLRQAIASETGAEWLNELVDAPLPGALQRVVEAFGRGG